MRVAVRSPPPATRPGFNGSSKRPSTWKPRSGWGATLIRRSPRRARKAPRRSASEPSKAARICLTRSKTTSRTTVGTRGSRRISAKTSVTACSAAERTTSGTRIRSRTVPRTHSSRARRSTRTAGRTSGFVLPSVVFLRFVFASRVCRPCRYHILTLLTLDYHDNATSACIGDISTSWLLCARTRPRPRRSGSYTREGRLLSVDGPQQSRCSPKQLTRGSTPRVP